MNMSFYNAAVGAYQQQLRMNVQAQNIANVNTQGYRAERAAFGELMNRNVDGIDNSRLPKGTGARMIHAPIDFSSRGFTDTGRNFDFAINGDGFFALFDPDTQEISFTRDGSFTMTQFWIPPAEDAAPEVDENGEEIEPQPTSVWRLSDNQGRCVLDPEGNFIVVDPDNQKAPLELGVFDYAIHYGMQHADSSRLLATDLNGQLYLGTGEVKQGLLEMSNTDLTQEFIKVIESQRAFSYALKMVITSDEIESTFNSLRG
ncbi:MAG: flagellar hook basal-body protein [Oscillospiraceae bacterium]|jgi:flagellar basal-body rod protein FlgG|nr:flagellar hook basal-body protein [Oscillospiraceae bacterium]MCI8942703.1 flagellar hook basal-body protein [Oscillospiraceae bacterium]